MKTTLFLAVTMLVVALAGCGDAEKARRAAEAARIVAEADAARAKEKLDAAAAVRAKAEADADAAQAKKSVNVVQVTEVKEKKSTDSELPKTAPDKTTPVDKAHDKGNDKTADKTSDKKVEKPAEAKEPPPLRHAKRVNFLRFSSSGALLASVSEDQTVKLWDMATRKELGALDFSSARIAGAYVDSLAFLPDEKALITVSAIPEDKFYTLMAWDVATRQRRLINGKDSWQIPRPASPLLSGAWNGLYAFSPDGKHFATVIAPKPESIFDKKSRIMPGSILLYRLETGWQPQEICVLQQETNPPKPTFSTDGKRMAAGVDRSMVVWDTGNQQQLASFGPYAATRAPTSVHLNGDGSFLYTVHLEGLFAKWDVPNQKYVVQRMFGVTGMGTLQPAPNGKFLAALVFNAFDNAMGINLWDTTEFKYLGVTDTTRGRRPVAFAFSPDGSKLAVADEDHVIHLWNPAELPMKRR